MSDYSQFIGILSGTLTSISLVPQLIKIIREKKAEGVSLGMFIVLRRGRRLGMVWAIKKRFADHRYKLLFFCGEFIDRSVLA